MLPEQSVRVSPTLIMVNQLLALSSQELQQTVRRELEQNPALESVENVTCPSCGAGISGALCPVCMQPIRPVEAPASQIRPAEQGPGSGIADDGFDPDDYRLNRTSQQSSDDDYDPLTFLANEASLSEMLLADLMASLPVEDHPIAEYLVGNLDEQGFLSCTVAAAAASLDVPADRVERVLDVLQRTAPIGVGARDLRECLLMQLHELEERDGSEIPSHVEEILTDHLTELGEHKYTLIAQALSSSYESVVAARDFIKRHFQPRPMQEPPTGRSWRSPSPTRFVTPDVIIRERDSDLEAEVVETYRFSLRLNSLYKRLSENGHSNAEISEGDRDHIRRYVNRGKLFISNINQRRETMLRITNCLIQLQDDFIRHGVRNLRPLTRAQVAQYLGIHESTVSRATAEKYVMLPNKQVVPFSDFFSASLSAKDVIREMISKENRPMTDKEIVIRLRDQGIRVARRTVTKYRNQLGIMPSAFR
jgi:RNA polymerase sigma-54 factor